MSDDKDNGQEKDKEKEVEGELDQKNYGETFIIPKAEKHVDKIYTRFIRHHKPFGFTSSHADLEFHPLPYKPGEDDELLLAHPWRIILEMQTEDQQNRMLGLDLYGDVILGRGESTPGCIMLDLEPYGATDLGVSRVHAKLRPTTRQLFIIDQGSTNKTMVNASPSGQGRAYPLTDGCMVTLGSMMFMVKVVKKSESDKQV